MTSQTGDRILDSALQSRLEVGPESAVQIRKNRFEVIEPFLVVLGLASVQVATAASYLLAARSQSVEDYGQAMMWVGVATVVSAVLDFGSNAFVAREISAGRLSQFLALGKLYTKTLGSALVTILASVILMTCGIVGRQLALAILLLCIGTILSTGLQSVLRASGRVIAATVALLAERCAALGIMWIYIIRTRPVNPSALVIALAAGSLVSTLVCAVKLAEGGLRGRLVNPFCGAAHFGLSGVLTSAQLADITLVGLTAGNSVAGAYAAVSRWTTPTNLMINAWVQSLTPRFSAARSLLSALRVAKRSSILLLFSWLFSLAVALFSPLLVGLTLGVQYSNSVGVLRYLALATIPASLNQLLVALLQSQGMDRSVGRIMAFGVPLQLALMCAAGTQWGGQGIGMALLVSQVVMFLGLFYVLRSATPLRGHST